MGNKEKIRLEDVPSMTGLGRRELREISHLLDKADPNSLTDDVLLGIGRAVEITLGNVPEIKREIAGKVRQLLERRKQFRFGK